MFSRSVRSPVLALFIFFGGMLGIVDRVVLSVLAPLMRVDLELGPSEIGLAFSAFSLGYLSLVLFGGWWADKYHAGRLMILVVFCWSVMCGLTGLAMGFWSLILLRYLFGAAEAPWQPVTNKALSKVYGGAGFATIFGLVTAGQPLGGAIAAPATSLIAGAVGWRATFWIIGALGLLWVVAWLVWGQRHLLNAKEAQAADGNMQRQHPVRFSDVTKVLKNPSIFATAFAYATAVYLQYFFLSWFPSFLIDEREFSFQRMGMLSGLPWASAVFSIAISGFISDAIVRRSSNPLRARKYLLAVILVGTGLTVMIVPFAPTGHATVILMSVAMGISYLGGGNYFALALKVAGPEKFGAACGIILMTGNVAGILSPAIAGFLISGSGGYLSSFMMTGVALLCGAVVIGVFVKDGSERSATSGMTDHSLYRSPQTPQLRTRRRDILP